MVMVSLCVSAWVLFVFVLHIAQQFCCTGFVVVCLTGKPVSTEKVSAVENNFMSAYVLTYKSVDVQRFGGIGRIRNPDVCPNPH